MAPPDAERPHRAKRINATPLWYQGSMRALLSNPLLGGWVPYRHERIKACDCSDIEQLAKATLTKDKLAATEGWRGCGHAWVDCVNVPAIVAPEQWEAAQQVRGARAKPHVGGRSNRAAPDRFLLSGLLICGRCQERLGSVTRKSGRHVYKCRGASCTTATCPSSWRPRSTRR